MALVQIYIIRFQTFQGLGKVMFDIRRREVPFILLRINIEPTFGSKKHLVPLALNGLADQFLRVPIAVYGRRINSIYPIVKGGTDRPKGVTIVTEAPVVSAHSPCP
ncbi:MAG: hypothetical protein A4E63_02949 [Syntrophorhabdus sp. PtaU1.Bin050]|nr:MAG: hypothetical protein A4E63_02949 [Syntrophorhabdus sp. PtaU1.Bin050]